MRCPPPSALPGISPTGGEIGWVHGFPQTMSVQHGETVDGYGVQATCDLPTCGGDGRQARGGLTRYALSFVMFEPVDDRVVGSQETPRGVNTGSPCRTGRPVKPYVSGIIEEWCEVISQFPSLNS
ncbi:hypothetical protein ACVIDN_007349 [Rhizobium brockwellii]